MADQLWWETYAPWNWATRRAVRAARLAYHLFGHHLSPREALELHWRSYAKGPVQ